MTAKKLGRGAQVYGIVLKVVIHSYLEGIKHQ